MFGQNILRRLAYLRNWEFVNIFFLPGCLYFVLSTLKIQTWQPYAYAMFVICLILAQGVLYWHLKLQAISKKRAAPPIYFYRLFPLFNRVNIILLAVYPVLAVLDQLTARTNFQVSLWSNLLFVFAVLEYINYYHYQLSHDNWNDIRYLLKFKKIRRSRLYLDMQESQKVSPAQNH